MHEPLPASRDLAERAERLTFVKDGIAWLALLFPVLWLLFHRMWLVLLGFIAVVAVFSFCAGALGLGDAAAGVLSVALSIVLALEANELRRWTLHRRGYTELGTVTGRSRDECEFRFLAAWLDEFEAFGLPERITSEPGIGTVRKAAPRAPQGQVVGLFPVSGG